MPTSLSLYLHIPFCTRICTYCAFNTFAGMEASYDAFVDALVREVQYLADCAADDAYTIKSISFGGGTPSLLTAVHYERIIGAIRAGFAIEPGAEISLEANPNDLNAPYLSALHQLGFNRISIGMQSAQPSELTLFDREHDHATVIQAVQAARQGGFDNINLDLIFGIPEQTLDRWRDTLQRAIDLNTEHVSIYALTLEGNTPLKDDVDSGNIPAPDDDLAADMYDLATDMLSDAGFAQYEISNWCKAVYQSQHNLQYWRNLPYAGLGPGAHGFAGGVRYSVMRWPQKYIETLHEAQATALAFPRTPAVARAVTVNRDDDIAETVMMGLRLTQEGIQRQVFVARFGVDLYDLRQEAIDKYIGYGLLYMDEQVIRLTAAGRMVSNAVIRDVM